MQTATKLATANESEIIKNHDKRIRAVARTFKRPGIDVDDLVQEGRMGLLWAARAWGGEGDLWGFATREVRTRMIRFVSAETAARAADVDCDELPAAAVVEIEALLIDALSSLTDEEREVLRMRFVDDISLREISLILGEHTETTQRTYHAALAKCRMYLGPQS